MKNIYLSTLLFTLLFACNKQRLETIQPTQEVAIADDKDFKKAVEALQNANKEDAEVVEGCKKINPKITDTQGRTLLFYVLWSDLCEQDKKNIIKAHYELDNSCLYCQDKKGNTFFHWAVGEGESPRKDEKVRLEFSGLEWKCLLQHVIEELRLNLSHILTNEEGNTPLHCLAKNAGERLWLSASDRSQEWPVLGNLVACLTKADCNIDAQNKKKQTPIHVAVAENFSYENFTSCRIKKEVYKVVNYCSCGCFSMSLKWTGGFGCRLIKAFIASGAKLDLHDQQGLTPLHIAIESGRTGNIERFKEKAGQECFKIQTKRKENVLHCFIKLLSLPSDQCIAHRKYHEVNDSSAGTNTPYIDILAILLQNTSITDWQATDISGNTPLALAKETKVLKNLQELLKEVDQNKFFTSSKAGLKQVKELVQQTLGK